MAHRSVDQDDHREGTGWTGMPWRKQQVHSGQPEVHGGSFGGDLSPNTIEEGNARQAPKRSVSIGRSSLEQMQNLAIHGQEERQRRSSSNIRSLGTVPLGLALITILVLAAYILRLSFVPVTHSQAVQRDGSCASRGCQEHLELLSESLDPAVDPCENPVAYVCKKVRWTSTIVSDAYNDMLVRWYARGSDFLAGQWKPTPALAMYEACLTKESNTVQRLEEVKTFLQERGLSWPSKTRGVRHALYVILDLLINWGVNFWFEISLRRLPGNSRYSLSLSYSESSFRHAKWVNYSKFQGERVKFVQHMYLLYGTKNERASELEDLVASEEAWNSVVSEAIATANHVVMQLRAADMERLTPNVSSERWLAYLNEHLRPHRVLPNDKVLIVDKTVTEATNKLFHRFSNNAILDLIAWRFVEEYSFATSYQAALTTFGNEDAVSEFRPRNCYTLAESRFQRALFLERAAATGSQEQLAVSAAQAVIEHVRNTTVRLLLSPSASFWLAPKAREEAAAIVRRTEFEPWRSLLGSPGSKPLLARTTLKDYMTRFPRSFATALGGWIEAAKIHKSDFPNWPRDDSLLHRHGQFSFLMQYDYWWNSVYVHLAATGPPMFYVDAPASVNYAGIGATIARQLVRGFDATRGSFLDSNRNIRSWMSREARGMLYNKTTCTGSWGDAIMHIAAAEVAYEAYREHRGPAEGNYTMPGHAVFTPDMLFFVSLCRSLCGLQDACATVLGNMTAFSRAFSCPPGSTVNMRNKCSFFRT